MTRVLLVGVHARMTARLGSDGARLLVLVEAAEANDETAMSALLQLHVFLGRGTVRQAATAAAAAQLAADWRGWRGAYRVGKGGCDQTSVVEHDSRAIRDSL